MISRFLCLLFLARTRGGSIYLVPTSWLFVAFFKPRQSFWLTTD